MQASTYTPVCIHIYKHTRTSHISIHESVHALTLICLFIVMPRRMKKYITRIGQKTGILKTEKKVQKKAINIARVIDTLRGRREEAMGV